MFHHDLEHTGETSDVIKNPEDLKLKWEFKTGDEIGSSLAVSGNYVYVGSLNGYILSTHLLFRKKVLLPSAIKLN